MNQLGPKHHAVTAMQQAQFRQDVDLRITHTPAKAGADSLAVDSRTFGKASRLGTPIAGVLSHSYGREWIAAHRKADAEAEAKARDNKQQTKTRSRQQTKASRGHYKAEKPAPKKRFTMKQFQNVESRLQLPKVAMNGSVTTNATL